MSIPGECMDDFDLALKTIKGFAAVHNAVAGTMAEGKLLCSACAREEQLTREAVEKYLRGGWPQCCGATMGYHGPIVPKEASARR
jgi:hypothetical protein